MSEGEVQVDESPTRGRSLQCIGMELQGRTQELGKELLESERITQSNQYKLISTLCIVFVSHQQRILQYCCYKWVCHPERQPFYYSILDHSTQ